jgi:hypothetical protein
VNHHRHETHNQKHRVFSSIFCSVQYFSFFFILYSLLFHLSTVQLFFWLEVNVEILQIYNKKEVVSCFISLNFSSRNFIHIIIIYTFYRSNNKIHVSLSCSFASFSVVLIIRAVVQLLGHKSIPRVLL